MNRNAPIYFYSFLSLFLLAIFYKAGVDVVDTFSPQGCRMSWMSPSYILQSSFDTTWTPLAKRYSLWLYREVGWDNHELRGSPVLFIPGNAGSSRQVRSIASSATRQYFSSPGQVAPEFFSGSHKPLDFFAVEFNEDLSAFHGITLESETQYTSRAIDYILSLYPPNTTVVILGHSMGGVVATSLLPRDNIAAIITMSTPYHLPPARFDRRIETIFDENKHKVVSDPTPLMSLCGGATDLMVPSEFCDIPESDKPYRRTIFTSALEGCWTGVGHQEMVWCHQVRWRVARAVLELTIVTTVSGRGEALDYWLRGGHFPSSTVTHVPTLHPTQQAQAVPNSQNLVLRHPDRAGVYTLTIPPDSAEKKFVMFLSQGSIGSTAPHHPLPLRATVEICTHRGQCHPLPPTNLKLIPNPLPGSPFPIPKEGSDEAEGVVFFEGNIDGAASGSVKVYTDGADGRGWVVAGFVQEQDVLVDVGAILSLWSTVSVVPPQFSLVSRVQLPRILSNALVVYRLTAHTSSACPDALFQPLLQHTSGPSESHYFPLSPQFSSKILLHTHASAPYVQNMARQGFNLTIYSSAECPVTRLDITMDWWATVGRWGVRYWSAVGIWAIGVVSFLCWFGWNSGSIGPVRLAPSVVQIVCSFSTKVPLIALWCLAISLAPFPIGWWLGNGGALIFSLLAPLLLIMAVGLVTISWWVLTILMWLIGAFSKIVGLRRAAGPSAYSWRSTLTSIALVLVTVFLLVPWQVAFLGCWVYHLFSCAIARARPKLQESPSPIPLTPSTPELLRRSEDDNFDPSSPTEPASTRLDDSQNAREFLLLLMTWLLPFSAPVLAVWVRTLMTAGYTTPFNGDHNVLHVAPFLIMVELGPSSCGLMSSSSRHHALSSLPRWAFAMLTFVSVMFGARYTYVVFEFANVALWLTLFVHYIPFVWTWSVSQL